MGMFFIKEPELAEMPGVAREILKIIFFSIRFLKNLSLKFFFLTY